MFAQLIQKSHMLTAMAILGFCVACTTATAPDTPQPEPTPTFDAAKLGTAVYDLTYCTPDDSPQKMDIYYPQSGGPWPVLLYIHGGSWREGDKGEGEGWRGLNERGYLVAAINYRLAAEKKFPVMIEDTKCAVRYLRAHAAQHHLDPDHIAAIGASAGGHLVALLGLADETAGWDVGEYPEQSSQVQAVITMSGLSDFTDKLPSGINSSIYYAFGALAGSGKPIMTAASPVTYITADAPPFLILHGDNDGVVPVEQSHILHDRLTEASASSTLVIVQNGDHGLQGANATPTSEEINQIIVDFLAKHLP